MNSQQLPQLRKLEEAPAENRAPRSVGAVLGALQAGAHSVFVTGLVVTAVIPVP